MSAEPLAQLSPPETGMLFSDQRAILATLTLLSGARLIGSNGFPMRGLTPEDKRQLDWFTLAAYDSLSFPGPRNVSSLTRRLQDPLRRLRAGLVERGLLVGPDVKRARTIAAVPIFALAGIGAILVIAGVLNFYLYWFLAIALVGAASFVRQTKRLTDMGTGVRTKMMYDYAYLNPRNSPAFASYGAMSAGLSAALFGGAALWALDPWFARTTGVSSSSGDSSLFGFDGSSSDSGDGGSSGGCGGGGG